MTDVGLVFPGQAPIFALPSTVFFPGTRLPLHVFEQRYREMTKAALDGDKLIAVALLKPGWESDYEGNPPIYDVCTVGSIVAAQALPDGRYNILLEGVSRFRPERLIQEKPYRIARGRLLPDWVDPLIAADVVSKSLHLTALVARLAEENSDWEAVSSAVRAPGLSAGRMADIVASAMKVDASAKQKFLEVEEVDARLAAMVGMMGKLLDDALAAKDPPDDSDQPYRWN